MSLEVEQLSRPIAAGTASAGWQGDGELTWREIQAEGLEKYFAADHQGTLPTVLTWREVKGTVLERQWLAEDRARIRNLKHVSNRQNGITELTNTNVDDAEPSYEATVGSAGSIVAPKAVEPKTDNRSRIERIINPLTISKGDSEKDKETPRGVPAPRSTEVASSESDHDRAVKTELLLGFQAALRSANKSADKASDTEAMRPIAQAVAATPAVTDAAIIAAAAVRRELDYSVVLPSNSAKSGRSRFLSRQPKPVYEVSYLDDMFVDVMPKAAAVATYEHPMTEVISVVNARRLGRLATKFVHMQLAVAVHGTARFQEFLTSDRPVSKLGRVAGVLALGAYIGGRFYMNLRGQAGSSGGMVAQAVTETNVIPNAHTGLGAGTSGIAVHNFSSLLDQPQQGPGYGLMDHDMSALPAGQVAPINHNAIDHAELVDLSERARHGAVPTDIPEVAPVPQQPGLQFAVKPGDHVWNVLQNAGFDHPTQSLKNAVDESGLSHQWVGSGTKQYLVLNGHTETEYIIEQLTPYLKK